MLCFDASLMDDAFYAQGSDEALIVVNSARPAEAQANARRIVSNDVQSPSSQCPSPSMWPTVPVCVSMKPHRSVTSLLPT